MSNIFDRDFESEVKKMRKLKGRYNLPEDFDTWDSFEKIMLISIFHCEMRKMLIVKNRIFFTSLALFGSITSFISLPWGIWNAVLATFMGYLNEKKIVDTFAKM